jgi:hypothetical protein
VSRAQAAASRTAALRAVVRAIPHILWPVTPDTGAWGLRKVLWTIKDPYDGNLRGFSPAR